MKKAIILMSLFILMSTMFAREYDPELKMHIEPHCYGDKILIKVEETYLDENNEIQWRPSVNSTVLIKHFSFILNINTTNNQGYVEYIFPTASIYGIKANKLGYSNYHSNELLLKSCLIEPYEPPEAEPYVHVPPVVNPPEPGTLAWARVVMLW